MDFRYSDLVDASSYDFEGLCDGIDLRVHKAQDAEDLGAIQAQEDWRKYVGRLGVYQASLGPNFNFLSASFPEIKAERMKILGYIDEFIFLHDDVIEAVDQSKGDQQNDEVLEACLAGAKAKRDTGRKLMISKVSQTILAMDPEPATATLTLWADFFAKGAGRRCHNRFDNLDDFMEYRILDVGQMYLTGVAVFGMGLNIPAHEYEIRKQLCRPAWFVIGLTNDLFSWPKERQAAKESGEGHVCNTIWVIMNQHSVDEAEAEKMCRQEIKKYVAEYVEIARQTKTRTDLSRDLRIFVEAIQYTLSGNLAWTRDAPRYNPGAVFNARQLGWMANGTPKDVEHGNEACKERKSLWFGAIMLQAAFHTIDWALHYVVRVLLLK